MSKNDVKELLITMICCFPGYKPSNVGEVIDKWYEQLKDIEYCDANAELSRYIKNNPSGFPPSVSNLIPKKNDVYGFTGRTYTDEFFEELENEVKQEMLRGINERSEIIRK